MPQRRALILSRISRQRRITLLLRIYLVAIVAVSVLPMEVLLLALLIRPLYSLNHLLRSPLCALIVIELNA